MIGNSNWTEWRASGKGRIWNPELDQESGTGTGTGIRTRKVNDIQLFYFSYKS